MGAAMSGRAVLHKDGNRPAPGHRFRVEYRAGAGCVVVDPDNRSVWGPCGRTEAERACARLQDAADRAAKRGPRPCLRCGTRFDSEGIHNRMCPRCRAVAGQMAHRFAP